MILRAISFTCFISIAIHTAKATDASLVRNLTTQVTHQRFHRAHLGVKVIALPAGKTVFDHQGRKLFKPASNAKLFTGAFVLDRFDPAHRLQTSCYTIGKPSAQGSVAGDLIIYGRGDPSFTPRFHRGDLRKPFRSFAKAIHDAGIRKVAGNLVADASYFNIPPFGSGWTWDDLLESYGAEVSALSANDNIAHINISPAPIAGSPVRIETRPRLVPFEISNRTITGAAGSGERLHEHRPFLRNEFTLTGSLGIDGGGQHHEFTVRAPEYWFGMLLKRELEEMGISIDGTVVGLNWDQRVLNPLPAGGLHHVASVTSPSLLELTRVMMKDSQNLYSQLLLLQAGIKFPQAGLNTEKAAVKELNRFLKGAGISEGEALLEEGSGLSRRALLTPDAIVQLLSHMHRHPRSSQFKSTLTIAGRDGTLAHRMKQTAAANNVRGKTGSLNGIKSLSGYVKNRSGQEFAFSILLNHHGGSGASARNAIDKIAVMLAESSGLYR